MNKKNGTYALLAAALLTGCVSTQQANELVWVKYFAQQGGALQAMHFLKKTNPAKTRTTGVVQVKNGRSYAVFHSGGQRHFTLLDNNSQNNLADGGVASLVDSQSVRFFEFGDLSLTVADFHAPRGLCQNYVAGGVNANVATNVYQNYGVFTTAFSDITLSANTAPVFVKTTFSSYPNTPVGKNFEQKVRSQQSHVEKVSGKKLNEALATMCQK